MTETRSGKDIGEHEISKVLLKIKDDWKGIQSRGSLGSHFEPSQPRKGCKLGTGCKPIDSSGKGFGRIGRRPHTTIVLERQTEFGRKTGTWIASWRRNSGID